MSQNALGGSPVPLPSWPRLSAAALDFLVLAAPQLVVADILLRVPLVRLYDFLKAHQNDSHLASNSTYVALSNHADAAFFRFLLVAEAIAAIYLIAMYLSTGATVGKLALGLRITRVDGTPMRPRDAVMRSLVFWAPLLLTVVGIGIWLWLLEYVGGTLVILLRPDRRGPEDLLGRTIVVRVADRGRPLADFLPLRPVQLPPEQPPSPAQRGYLPGWGPREQPPPATGEPPREEEKS